MKSMRIVTATTRLSTPRRNFGSLGEWVTAYPASTIAVPEEPVDRRLQRARVPEAELYSTCDDERTIDTRRAEQEQQLLGEGGSATRLRTSSYPARVFRNNEGKDRHRPEEDRVRGRQAPRSNADVPGKCSRRLERGRGEGVV